MGLLGLDTAFTSCFVFNKDVIRLLHMVANNCHPSLAESGEPVVEEIRVDEAEGEDGSKCITGGGRPI